jgi:hypothetical protein
MEYGLFQRDGLQWPPEQANSPGRRPQNPSGNTQQCRFTGAIEPDQRAAATLFEIEGRVAKDLLSLVVEMHTFHA